MDFLSDKVPKKVRAIIAEEVSSVENFILRNNLPKSTGTGCSRWVVGEHDRDFIIRVWNRTTRHSNSRILRSAILTALSALTGLYLAAVLMVLWEEQSETSPAQILCYEPPPPARVSKIALYRTLMRMMVVAETSGNTLLAAFILDIIPDDVYDRYARTKIRSGGFYTENPETLEADQLALRLLLWAHKTPSPRTISLYGGWSMDYVYSQLRRHTETLDSGMRTSAIAEVQAAFLT